MAQIRIDLSEPLVDGMDIKFKAPCNCNEITGLIVYYPEENDVTNSKSFTLKDACGNTLTGVGDLFSRNGYVKVIVDTNNNYAYIQNAATTKQTASCSLTVAGWSSSKQTVSVKGVTTTNSVIVVPAPASHIKYNNSQVYCSAQGNGTLTFTCVKTPTVALTVNVLILR